MGIARSMGSSQTGDGNGDTRLILDGQQRLTSCYRAFFGGVDVERHAGRYYFDYPPSPVKAG